MKTCTYLPTYLGTKATINEIFFSLQGEASRVGLPTVFIRLTGCPLRCSYCDTEYAFHGGNWLTIDAIVEQVQTFPTRHVTVTGGEPLAQKSCHILLTALCDAGFDVSLETSGALEVATVDPRVARIVDVKTPASGEADRNCWANLALLTPRDEVKFVLVNEADYLWAKQVLQEHHLTQHCLVLFSPAWSVLDASALASWILRDGLPVRMQIQLHKILWQEARGR